MRKNRRVIIAYVIPTLLALFLSLSAEGESIWAQWDESRPQLEVRYLDAEIILSGKRKTPELYYLNMDRQPQLFGEYIAQGIALEEGVGLYDVGLCVREGERASPSSARERVRWPCVVKMVGSTPPPWTQSHYTPGRRRCWAMHRACWIFREMSVSRPLFFGRAARPK